MTDDFLRQAKNYIIELLTVPLLTVPLNNISPVLEAGDNTHDAVFKVAKMINRTNTISAQIPSIEEDSISNTLIENDSNVLPRVSPPKARSRYAGYFRLLNNASNTQ